MKKVLTLCIVQRDGKVLLGMKKRGFGAGQYNGFGGKVEAGETVAAAAMRELQEEVGITTRELILTGELTFTFEAGSDPLLVYIFRVANWEGEPVETEEMRPEWFLETAIPYETMWSDDIYWLPHLLSGQCFVGSVHFDAPASKTQSATILAHTLELVSEVEFSTD